MSDTTYCYINNYNRYWLPRRMYEYLSEVDGITPYIVDNASTYPPLLEWYEKEKPNVKRLDINLGSCSVWRCNILDEHNVFERYIITDPDLDLSGIPKDFPHLLHLGLDKTTTPCKVGFSLEINDIPQNDMTAETYKWENQYWANARWINDDAGNKYKFYDAYIDTTFALYRSRIHDFPALRTDRPYTAFHRPWYYTSLEDTPEDEIYYLKSLISGQSFYSGWLIKLLGLDKENTDNG